MSVLVWVMGDGEHQDMIATCRAGDGDWLTFRWDYRETGGVLGFRHDFRSLADDQLADWTEELEANGSTIIALPTEIVVNTPEDSWDVTVMAWWNSVLRPIAVDLNLSDPADLSFDEGCTMRLPPAVDPRVIMCGPPPLKKLSELYSAKLAWGP